MKDKQYIFFDLDGTLTDSQEGITKSAAYALKHFGIEVEELSQLRFFIGPPLMDSFMNHFGFSEEKAAEAVKYFREYFNATGKFENRVYDGIPQVLERLKTAGKTLVVATSKAELFAKQILEHFELAKYFDKVYGADMEGTRCHKDQVIAYALEEMQLTDVSQVIMVGDKEHDVLGAKRNGIDTIGVLFGFGSRQELEESGAAVIVETVEEIGNVILGK